MLSENSPFLNIPAALDKKQAVFLDGLRHSAQIADHAYTRLCAGLTEQSVKLSENRGSNEFTPLFLDVWAFIDSTDRFRSLWEMQPYSADIPEPYSKSTIKSQLSGIRDLRNVSAHISQKIDQIIAINSSVLGSINWLTMVSKSPVQIKSCFIRPGIMLGMVSDQLAIPSKEIQFCNDSGHVSVTAGKHTVMLTDAYYVLRNFVEYAEQNLMISFQQPTLEKRLPSDLIGIADLNLVKY